MAKGPRNIGVLSLMKYRFPINALVSILHRLSGVILFLFIPFILWTLHLSLSSQANFLMVKDYFGSPIVMFFTWVVLSALYYHVIAGVKHLLMDVGYFEEKVSGRIASIVVIILGMIGVVGIGAWIVC
ncbi:MAG: succinate dehydrogenase, cytochrome b556 subunit [Gammaproteobacteria bacterium]|jgi:succinate dehydrogenase / fumarate reductase cytochrome b subunit|nr:succinate dehydrogenase, cytochrome b556 subunit [Gammaproteobacteria bacterium]